MRRLTAAAWLALVTALPACNVPDYPGPQIQSPPPAFTLNPETQLERRMFDDLEVVYHDAWVEAAWGNFSGIYINGHPGSLGRAQVEAARARALQIPPARPDQVRDFGEVEELTIDGRTAYGWPEMVRSQAKGIEYVAYRAAIPYDTITYAVEFISGEPGFKSHPDSLRTVVASFGIGRTTINFPLLLVAVGVGLFVVAQLRTRAMKRRQRLAGINLVQMPKPEKKDGEGADDGAPATPAAGGGAQAAGGAGSPGGGGSAGGAGTGEGGGAHSGPRAGGGDSPAPEASGKPQSLAEAIARQRALAEAELRRGQ